MDHRRFFALPTTVTILLLLATPCSGSEARPPDHGIWAGLGVGKSSLGRPAIQMNLSVRSGKLLLSLRKTSSDGGSYQVEGHDDSYDTMEDVGLLAGIAHHADRYQVSLAAGLASVRGTFHEPVPGTGDLHLKSDYAATAGIPLEAQLVWKAGARVGFGLYGYQNLNRHRHFGGLCLSIVLGWF